MKKLYFILLLSCFYAYSQKEELRFRMLYDKYTIEGENNIPQDSVAFFINLYMKRGKRRCRMMLILMQVVIILVNYI